MTAHVIAAPAIVGTAVFPAAPGWLSLSEAMTAEVPAITDRDDLLVNIAPGAGHGAPACLLHNGIIEIDGTHMGTVDPVTATPHLTSDRARYATVWGLLTHECAHARHSKWTPPWNADPDAVAAATLLEESRIEAAQIRRRPDDRHWLRASSANLVLNTTKANDPAHAPTMTARHAAEVAALLLARVDGGILTRAETACVTSVVRSVLGTPNLRKLRALWREAFTVADEDATAMLDIGRRWCEIVAPDAEAPEPSDPDTPPNTLSPLAKSVTSAVAKVARAVASSSPPGVPAPSAVKPKADADTERVADAARAVFDDDSSKLKTGGTATSRARPPTTDEHVAARVLARALSTAGVRDRVAVKTTSALPPGRLRMRGVLAREAQRAAGAAPTAEPFTRVTRNVVPTPPLRLGIACDVSGSMRAVTRQVASTAWILANAARHTPVSATTATVIFGNHVRPITYPGVAPNSVTEFHAEDSWEDVTTAIDALDGALGLSRPGAARLLVVISDGLYRADERRNGQKLVDRLRDSGCAVLWLSTDERSRPFNGATEHRLDVHVTDTVDNDDSKTAFCTCKWVEEHTTWAKAENAATCHRNSTDSASIARAVGRAATTALRTAR
ncbi:vWA domain-containing protein [Lentzea sp. JNUCC 0626]|uniref:vWA domain-containing protein n=1 Tax=Lentzea sp. JNUCC 0626 TaxID=3367513 RepID=UPI00374833B3